MPTMEDIIGWFLLLLLAGVIGLGVAHVVNPKNKLSRGIEAFWESNSIKNFRRSVRILFWFCVVSWLVVASIDYYFNDSGWYPREREVEVFFKANKWIDGEIQTCYS